MRAATDGQRSFWKNSLDKVSTPVEVVLLAEDAESFTLGQDLVKERKPVVPFHISVGLRTYRCASA